MHLMHSDKRMYGVLVPVHDAIHRWIPACCHNYFMIKYTFLRPFHWGSSFCYNYNTSKIGDSHLYAEKIKLATRWAFRRSTFPGTTVSREQIGRFRLFPAPLFSAWWLLTIHKLLGTEPSKRKRTLFGLAHKKRIISVPTHVQSFDSVHPFCIAISSRKKCAPGRPAFEFSQNYVKCTRWRDMSLTQHWSRITWSYHIMELKVDASVFLISYPTQEAVSGSTSFILSRIRDCLSSSPNNDDRTHRQNTTAPPTVMVTVSLGNADNETFQAEVITLHQTAMEEPHEDKLVQMGDMPRLPGPHDATTPHAWENPMIINTKVTPSTAVTPLDNMVTNVTAVTPPVADVTTTPRPISWQDDIPKGTVMDGETLQEMSLNVTMPNGSSVIAVVANATTMSANGTNATEAMEGAEANVTMAMAADTSSTTAATTTVMTSSQGPLIRRRIQPIKPIVSNGNNKNTGSR